MKVDKELIKHVADVARLHLTGNEVDKFVKDFQDILEAFSKVNKVDTKDVKPSFQPVDIKNFTRDDKVEPSLSQEEALSNTEHKKDGYFKGPKAI